MSRVINESLNVQNSPYKQVKDRRIDGQADSHSALFDHSTDVVQVVSKATHRQTQHLDLRLRPLGSEDEERTSASASVHSFTAFLTCIQVRM